jgi:hypothetical protein
MPRVLLAAALCGFSTLSLNGCAVMMTRFAHGAPDNAQPVALQRRGQAAIARMPDVDIAFEAQGVRRTMSLVLPLPIPFPHSHRRRMPDRLPIWLELLPHAECVRFDPRAIRIVTAAGDTLRPEGMWGPGIGSITDKLGNELCRCGFAGDAVGAGLDRPYYKRTETRLKYDPCFDCEYGGPPPDPMRGPLEIHHATCFVIDFVHPPTYEFTLILDGVESERGPLRLPPFRFARGNYWSIVGVFPFMMVWI